MSRVKHGRHGEFSSHYPIRQPVSLVLSRVVDTPDLFGVRGACTYLDFARGARVAGLPESSFGVGCTGRAADADVVRTMGSGGAGVVSWVVFRVYRLFSRSWAGREGSKRVGSVRVGVRRVAMLLQRRHWVRTVRHLVWLCCAYEYPGVQEVGRAM